MKVTVVPAQVTTVEDRIMGSLSFSQMMLIVAPIFISTALYAVLPPMMGASTYKFVIMASLAGAASILAIRFKGKILASWLLIILRYQLRPAYYLYDKNTLLHRADYGAAALPMTPETANEERTNTSLPQRLGLPETVRVLQALDNPATKLRFETTKKGGLYVRFTEIED